MTTIEERKMIQRMSERGYKSSEIAETLGWKISTVRKWRQRLKKGAHLKAKWGVQEEGF